MTSQSKSSSRWGNLFQQAVAGVESRLDTILAEDERPPPRSADREGNTKVSARSIDSVASSKAGTGENSKGLQDRLAKAVKSRPSSDSTQSSQLGKSRTVSTVETSNKSEFVPKAREPAIEDEQSDHDTRNNGEGDSGVSQVDASSDEKDDNAIDHMPAKVTTEESFLPDEQKHSNDTGGLLRTTPPTQQETSFRLSTLADHEEILQQGHIKLDSIERQQGDDAANSLEDIESIQAKLKLLAQDLLKEADRTTAKPESSDLQRQIAQRDARIALLIQEGTKLSQNEVKLLNSNKKLRAKIAELEKASLATTQAEMTSRAQSRVLKEKIESLETSQRDNAQSKDLVISMKANIHRLVKQLEAKESQILELRDQMEKNISRAKFEEGERWKDLLNTEKRRVVNVEQDLSTLRFENDAAMNCARLQIHELETKLGYESNSKAKLEIDLKGEIQGLESRLESFRAHSEENTSEISNDTQAKLVRQIETLQSSYTVANENWREIESSLMSRITTLEREQTDIHKRETDSRRRTREATTRSRELETRLAQETMRVQELEEAIGQRAGEMTLLKTSLTSAESDLQAAQQQLASLKYEQNARSQAVIVYGDAVETNANSSKPENDAPIATPTCQDGIARTGYFKSDASPGLFGSRLPSTDRSSLKSPIVQSRNHSNADVADALDPQYSSRQSSSGLYTVHQDHSEDMFDGVITPATPERTINDVFSTSTAAAGPSVQLVERMSAAMRRLESEKAASKDEIDHLAKQRDEARGQVTALMTELSGKQAVEERVYVLEAESQDLSLRLHTTLEMLGEKSELVEELRADIADMKEIYRTTLEDTVK